jgi:phenylalanyl-tRNA synthetase alpha subunit
VLVPTRTYTVGELSIDDRLETADYDLALETALRRMFDRDLLRFGHSYFPPV